MPIAWGKIVITPASAMSAANAIDVNVKASVGSAPPEPAVSPVTASVGSASAEPAVFPITASVRSAPPSIVESGGGCDGARSGGCSRGVVGKLRSAPPAPVWSTTASPSVDSASLVAQMGSTPPTLSVSRSPRS